MELTAGLQISVDLGEGDDSLFIDNALVQAPPNWAAA